MGILECLGRRVPGWRVSRGEGVIGWPTAALCVSLRLDCILKPGESLGAVPYRSGKRGRLRKGQAWVTRAGQREKVGENQRWLPLPSNQALHLKAQKELLSFLKNFRGGGVFYETPPFTAGSSLQLGTVC